MKIILGNKMVGENKLAGRLLVLMPLLFMLQACTSGILGQGGIGENDKQIATFNTFLQSENLALSTRIKIADMRIAYRLDYLRANVVLKNRWHFSQDFKYKFIWFDEDGLEINPELASWTPIKLHGKTEQTVAAIAPSTSAKSFKIQIRD